jgi:hypothetical protein
VTAVVRNVPRNNQADVWHVKRSSIEGIGVAGLHHDAQPQLSMKAKTWYFAAHGLLEKLYPEKVEWLENCFYGQSGMHRLCGMMTLKNAVFMTDKYNDFRSSFADARGLIAGSLERAKSLEYDTVIRIRSELVSDEFDTAQQLFDTAGGDESILRAAGTVGRVALERHLFTVADARGVEIKANSRSGKKMAQDVINGLEKAGVISKIQKSELESLFKIGNNCAHPKEQIKAEDIERLLRRGKELTATIV